MNNSNNNFFDTKSIKKVTIIGLIVNVILAIIKLLFGFFGNSSSLVADGFHSFSDMLTDLSILWGVDLWNAPPDKNHPYGHLRIEAMITIFIGVCLIMVASGLIYNSIFEMKSSEIKIPKTFTIIAALISIFSKEFVYQWTIRIGNSLKSSAVIANAWHHRSDALSSIPVIIALIIAINFPNFAYVDKIGALIVSVFIFKVSWKIIIPAIYELSDHGATQDDIDKIKSQSFKTTGVMGVHAVRSRHVGSGLMVDLHILVSPLLSVREGHTISENVKIDLLNSNLNIFDVVIHIEPLEDKNDIKNDEHH